LSCKSPAQNPTNPTRSRSLLNVLTQHLHLIGVMLPVFRDNPERPIPAVRANGKAVTSERELCANILAGPEKPPPLGKHNSGHALDDTAHRRKSDDRDSEADAFVVFFCDHAHDA
jgi:hypothetical protein